MKTILKNKNFLLLWQGQAISQTGTHIFNVVRVYWIVENVDKAWLVGLLLTLCSLTVTIISPVGGYFADHYSRKRIIILSDIISGFLMFFLAALMLAPDIYVSWQLISLFLASILISASTSFFNPAVMASIPNMIDKGDISKANSWLFSAGNVAQIIGQGIGGWLVAIFSTPVLLIANGASFIFSAISEIFIDFNRDRSNATTECEHSKEISPTVSRWNHFKVQLLAGFNSLKSDKTAWATVLYSALSSFLFLPIFVLTPFVARDVFAGGSVEYGYFIASLSIGMLSGNVFVMLFKGSKPFLSMLTSSIIIRFLGFWFVGLGFSLFVAIFGFFLIGAAVSTEGVLITTHLQKRFDQNFLGRIMGFSQMLSASLAPVAFLGAGLLAEWAPASVSGWYIASPLLSLVSLLLFYTNSSSTNQKPTGILNGK